jgi:F0F1-type ATP synthase assembly protein I
MANLGPHWSVVPQEKKNIKEKKKEKKENKENEEEEEEEEEEEKKKKNFPRTCRLVSNFIGLIMKNPK